MKTGQLIKELRLKKGMTQEDIADMTGFSVWSIQRIENGAVEPRADSLHRIASALDVPFEELNSYTEKRVISKGEKIWLSLLHLSAIFLIVILTVIIWMIKKDEIDNIRTHAIDVINFQLNLLMIIIPYALLYILIITIPVLVLTALLGFIVILINGIRVAIGLPYKYPVFYSFLKY